MAGLGLYALEQQQYVQAERVGLELARSVGTAVTAEVRSSISILETLATSPTLDAGDLGGFRERANRVMAARPEWFAIELADATGRPLLDTRVPADLTVPDAADDETVQRVVHTRAPLVGNLTGRSPADFAFNVRVPVVRDDLVRYVLTAVVKPEAIRGLLARQHVPSDWVISIMDANGVRVARSRAHEDNLGGRLSESTQRVIAAGGAEGFGLAYTLEGERIFAPYSRLPEIGWMAVLGMPTALVDAAAYRSLAVYGGGILLSLILGTVGAMWIARGITRPIADLREAAEALGRRQPLHAPTTSIQEVQEVGVALETAGRALTKSEAERDDLLSKERQARQEAESADRAKQEFMAVLSHELRTPLNAVYGWARMLQTGHVRGEALVARALDAIVRNADVQVQLIDDLLDLSRITSGKMRLNISRIDLSTVLTSALDAVRPAADGKSIRIETTIDPGIGAVSGDAARLQQVVWNLVINAVKFTPSGGLVQLQLRELQSQALIVVRDTGQGIAPDILPHVFDRFRQGDSSSTRTHGGLGLGLALVKHLVELHGGTVFAESDGPGRGATFIVSLPISTALAPAELKTPSVVSAAASDERPLLAARLDGVRILLADDDVDAVNLAEAILTNVGAEVRSCATASAALDVVKQWRPDVLVSDIEMPGEDGYELIDKVRALAPEEGGETPAIALSAYGRPQDRLRALAAGFTMHVPKPVDPGELTAIVASVAGRTEKLAT